MHVINVHVSETLNTGDIFSSPLKYFNFDFTKTEEKNIETFNADSYTEDSIIILGGGGLLNHHLFEPKLNEIVNKFKNVVMWGCGVNTHYDRKSYTNKNAKYIISKMKLVGTRDYNDTYVPCVSCMHKAFDIDYPIKYDTVAYEHCDIKLDIKGLPKIQNSGNSIEKKLEFLGSARNIVTNTYHGMYWGLLLNKNVTVKPFSTKFDYVKYPIHLQECRELNVNFYNRFKDQYNT